MVRPRRGRSWGTGGRLGVMGSQFDGLAKAMARGASRRRVLRGVLGGLIGAVAASVLPGTHSDIVEAGAPVIDSSLRQSSGSNQPAPSPNQGGAPGSARPQLNQAPVRLTQAPLSLSQIQPTSNQAAPRHSQASINQAGARFNQVGPRSARLEARVNQAR